MLFTFFYILLMNVWSRFCNEFVLLDVQIGFDSRFVGFDQIEFCSVNFRSGSDHAIHFDLYRFLDSRVEFPDFL